jgi:hypothetical protein
MAGPIEQKAVAAPATALVSGYLSAVLISTVPWLHTHLTPDQQQQLPIVIAFALSAAAAWLAPHTHRPDLVPVQPPAGAAKPDLVAQFDDPRLTGTEKGAAT